MYMHHMYLFVYCRLYELMYMRVYNTKVKSLRNVVILTSYYHRHTVLILLNKSSRHMSVCIGLQVPSLLPYADRVRGLIYSFIHLIMGYSFLVLFDMSAIAVAICRQSARLYFALIMYHSFYDMLAIALSHSPCNSSFRFRV